jgi:plastocyanin
VHRVVVVSLTAALTAAVAALALGGCTKDTGGAPTVPTSAVTTVPGEVVISDIAYHPATIRVHPGDIVHWRFDDNGVGHTVSADDGSFDSGVRTDGRLDRPYPTAGRFPYHCRIHARMHGTVVVE